MTRNQALKLAIKALNKQMHTIAYDANAYRKGIGLPSQEKRAAEYEKMADAIKILEALMHQKEMF